MDENNLNNQAEVAQEQKQDQKQDQLQVCQSQLLQAKSQLMYMSAEFDNFRKRTEKERVNWIISAQSGVLLDLISIADDFDRALSGQKNSESQEANNSVTTGLELIKKSISNILKKYDVQEISEITQFDPNLHEAVMQVESPDIKSGDIVAVLQKGYKFKGQVLRPAKVSVAK